MSDPRYHAHIYFEPAEQPVAAALRGQLRDLTTAAGAPHVLFAGRLMDRPVGPHPIPQFEIHFLESALSAIMPALEGSGLRALVHPLTNDDLADHTTLARWIGKPLALDLSILDPPGENKGVARFSKSDF